MRIYISGAITGHEYTAEGRFKAYTAILKQRYPEAEIVDPCLIGQSISHNANPTQDDYMHISFALMDICDTVFFMPSWKKSKGCQMERKYAEEKGMLIL